MSASDGDQENIYKWSIRYVLIPITLVMVSGVFALIVAFMASPNEKSIVTSVVKTLAATTPNIPPSLSPAPNDTPTAEPTATLEARLKETGEPFAFVPTPDELSPTPVVICGQVPAGWQIYIVQRGNTLYSLARNNGTTIDAIRQVNCLNELIAGTPIWLPNTFVEQPELPAEHPTITVTPTVTEPVALPDLINITGNQPTVSVDCSIGLNAPSCVTIVSLTVGNVGSVAAGSFNVQVMLDPAQSVELNQSIEFLEPGETVTFPLTIPPGVSCSKGCTVFIIVDSGNVVVEDNEGNNQVEITFLG